jgi:quercetin dioxygenase-like cupin family protein
MELASIDLGKRKRETARAAPALPPHGDPAAAWFPLHSHADRPALIMVNQGQIFEYSSKCLVPISHKAGDIARESNGLMHWWKNEGNAVVVLTIADIVNDKKPDSMMPMM